jgi:glyoxylase-like metal-dependent hydrolase (beta-lactamase superfamily II)
MMACVTFATLKPMKIDAIPMADQYSGYLITDENTHEAILIDPFHEETKIQALIDQHQSKIKYLVLTHYPAEHTSSALPYLLRQFGTEVIIHENDSENLNLGSRDPLKMEVRGGESLNIGGKPIKLLFTPGITSGSMCVFVENALFTGPLRFDKVALNIDPFTGITKEEIYKGYMRVAKLPEASAVYPGTSSMPANKTLNEYKTSFESLKAHSVDEFLAVARK